MCLLHRQSESKLQSHYRSVNISLISNLKFAATPPNVLRPTKTFHGFAAGVRSISGYHISACVDGLFHHVVGIYIEHCSFPLPYTGVIGTGIIGTATGEHMYLTRNIGRPYWGTLVKGT